MIFELIQKRVKNSGKRRIFHHDLRKYNEWVELRVARNILYWQYLVNHRLKNDN